VAAGPYGDAAFGPVPRWSLLRAGRAARQPAGPADGRRWRDIAGQGDEPELRRAWVEDQSARAGRRQRRPVRGVLQFREGREEEGCVADRPLRSAQRRTGQTLSAVGSGGFPLPGAVLSEPLCCGYLPRRRRLA